jgi:adenosine deaminase
MITAELKDFIHRIPKAELHCHLEGSIQPATLIKLAERHGIDLPFTDVAGAERFYEFTSLNQFLEIFALACGTLKTAADFETITADLAADAVRQNIVYREVFFTYAYHDRRDVPWEEVTEGLAAGRQIAKARYGVEMWFIADIDRTVDPEEGMRLVEMAHASREDVGIIGIGLDSQEIDYPASRHRPAYERAKELGFHLVGHAGEDVGPESVWDALDIGVERIDHGVRSIEDEELLDYLVENDVALTVCPVSNIALKVFPDMASHPIKDLYDAGVKVTINSDDPPMFHTDLINDYIEVVDTFDLDADDVEQIVRNGFDAAFLDAARRADYLQRFEDETAKLRASLID